MGVGTKPVDASGQPEDTQCRCCVLLCVSVQHDRSAGWVSGRFGPLTQILTTTFTPAVVRTLPNPHADQAHLLPKGAPLPSTTYTYLHLPLPTTAKCLTINKKQGSPVPELPGLLPAVPS
jgi:hypothetical protein